jgi:hypothetical protein
MSMFSRPSGSSRRRSARRAAVRAAVSALFKRMARRPAAPASLVAAAALALPLHGLAQDTGERVVLAAAPIVITATRTPTRVDETLAEVSVIDRAALDRAGGRTLAELLAQQPGVQFWSDGGLGKRSSVSLRGLESRHTLLLIDGVRVGSATVGAPAWESLPLAAIERIEIVRGPLSSLYGSDAVGGVVQVFTRRGGQGLQGGASLGAGSEGLRQAAGHLRFGQDAGQGGVELAAGVQHTELDGVSATNARVPFGAFDPDRDGWRQTGGHLSLGWRFADGWRADLQALHADGVTQLDDGPGADARAGLRTGSLSLRVGGAIGPGWRSTLQLARSTDDYETIASASPWAEIGTIGTVQRQIGWEHQLATPAGALLLLAERVTQSVSRPGAPFEVDERTHHRPGRGPERQRRRPPLAGQPAARPQLAVRPPDHRLAGLRADAGAGLARRRRGRHQLRRAQLQPAVLPRLQQPRPAARGRRARRAQPAVDRRRDARAPGLVRQPHPRLHHQRPGAGQRAAHARQRLDRERRDAAGRLVPVGQPGPDRPAQRHRRQPGVRPSAGAARRREPAPGGRPPHRRAERRRHAGGLRRALRRRRQHGAPGRLRHPGPARRMGAGARLVGRADAEQRRRPALRDGAGLQPARPAVAADAARRGALSARRTDGRPARHGGGCEARACGAP